jgi:ferrous iron transport protein B
MTESATPTKGFLDRLRAIVLPWRRPKESPYRFGQSAILLVGNLKVGKSTLFSYYLSRGIEKFTYRGTGVELTYGNLSGESGGRLIDAPGIYSLHDRSEDAFVVRDLIVRQRVGRVILILDAKNLRRSLPLAFQLAELRIPVVVALNMADEGRHLGVKVDTNKLAALLGVPVVSTVAVEGQGVAALRRSLAQAKPIALHLELPQDERETMKKIAALLGGYDVQAEGLAYLLALALPRTREVLEDEIEPERRAEILRQLPAQDAAKLDQLSLQVSEQILRQASEIVAQTVEEHPPIRTGWSERLGVWTRLPLTGIPIAVVVLALTYGFVGFLGADVLVSLVEGKLFGQVLMPLIRNVVGAIPSPFVQQLLVGQFGLLSVGIVLSIGIVLPVLATFFVAFAVLEDTGYLPRLSIITDRLLRRIGLNGKGALPLIMGFSCVTMAILTTRMLDTRKQRILATLLLVSVIPCAPLMGVMMVLLVRMSPLAAVILFGVLIFQFFLVGMIGNLLLPGERSDFVLELPPLRPPQLRNIVHRTGLQLFWFFREAIPYFLLGALILFTLEQLGALQALETGLRPILVHWLGLPPESADIFLMTLIRREAGASLLVAQYDQGLYDGVAVLVTLLVMNLLAPCINALLVMFKERGAWVSSAILIWMIPYALAIGSLVNALCRGFGLVL